MNLQEEDPLDFAELQAQRAKAKEHPAADQVPQERQTHGLNGEQQHEGQASDQRAQSTSHSQQNPPDSDQGLCVLALERLLHAQLTTADCMSFGSVLPQRIINPAGDLREISPFVREIRATAMMWRDRYETLHPKP